MKFFIIIFLLLTILLPKDKFITESCSIKDVKETSKAYENIALKIKEIEEKEKMKLILEAEKERVENKKRLEETNIIKVEVSFYCPCSICCGKWATLNPGITASGTKAKWGTIAAPKELPFGTKLKINSFGDKVFTVEDTGSYIKKVNNIYRLDVWTSNHSDALRRGRYNDFAEIIK